MPLLYLNKNVLNEIKRRAGEIGISPGEYVAKKLEIDEVDGRSKHGWLEMEVGETRTINVSCDITSDECANVWRSVRHHNRKWSPKHWTMEVKGSEAIVTRVR